MFKNLNPRALGLRVTFPETLELAKVGGFEGVDLPVSEVQELLKTKSVGEIWKAIKMKGLKTGGWALPVNFRGSEETFRKDLERLSGLAKIATEFECQRVFTWILPFSDSLPFGENFKLHVDRLLPVAEVLKDYGCVLGLEFVGPRTSRVGHKCEFIYDMDGMLELRDAIGAGNVGLLLDAWHWYTTHGTVDQIKRLKGNDVVYVHVNDAPTGIPVDEQIDSVRRLPGETGVIDIVGFLKALDQIGYDGPVTPEPFDKKLSEQPVQNAVSKVGRALDEVWKSAGL